MSVQSNPEFMNPNYQEAPEKEDSTQEPLKDEAVAAPKEETAPKEDPVEEKQEEKAPEPEPASESDKRLTAAKEENMKTLRELKLKAERERDELLARINAAEKPSRPKELPEDDSDDDFNFGDDDLIEGKHIKKLVKKLNKVNSQLGQYQQQDNLSKTERKIKQRYNDFDEVVTQENLQILAARDPEMAQGLNANPDLYSKALMAYTMIKDLQIYIPPQDKKRLSNLFKESKKIDENLSVPKVAASISPQTGDSALSKASEYTDNLTSDEAARVYAEMIKRSSF